MSSRNVLVIGGGLAGMSSAVALGESGFRVCLLEKRPHLGGRATSYTLPDGSEVDNCQHVTLGCCTNLSDFYRRVGAANKIRFYDRLYFVDARGRRSTIEAAPLPPPLHMAPSFLLFDALSFADKRSIASGLMAIATAGGRPRDIEGISMLEWLHRMEQTPGAIERYWRVVLVSALDEELARTDARYGIEVFWKAFLGNREGYRVGIPSVPLAELYEGCRDSIERRGGEVRLRCGIREIQMNDHCFSGALLDDGSQVRPDACVVAVPHDVLLGMLPVEMSEPNAPLEGLRHLRTSPITGGHLWFDRTVMTEPFLTLLDHTTQWVFNKTLLYAGAETDGRKAGPIGSGAHDGDSSGQYIQLVISASYDLVQRSRQEIIDLGFCDARGFLAQRRVVSLALTDPPCAVVRGRSPTQAVCAKNFFFAGDLTRPGWPAPMEGAVRIGYLAAE